VASIQGKGWLIVGFVAAIAVPAVGLHTWLPAALTHRLELPWAGLLTGVLIFLAFAGLYFRAHWIATAAVRRNELEQLDHAVDDLRELAADVDRTGSVMVESLDEIARDPDSPTSRLYFDGVRAHAARLRTLAERARARAAALADSERR